MSNAVDLAAEEMPTQPDVTYMVEPAPVTTASGRSGIDESLVVFCVDISGSMCVSQEVRNWPPIFLWIITRCCNFSMISFSWCIEYIGSLPVVLGLEHVDLLSLSLSI